MNNINGKMHINIKNTEPKRITSNKKQSGAKNEAAVTDFSNPAAEALGRSQLSGQVDNIENDVTFIMQNPDKAVLANTFFDSTYEQMLANNDEEAYEKSAMCAGMFREEFLSK